MRSRFRHIILIHILVCAALLVAGCRKADKPAGAEATPLPAQALAATEGGSRDAASAIKALGILRPAQTLQLSFGASGPVSSVAAWVGMDVKRGDLLAELNTTALEFELQRARESVALRQAALDGLLNEPNTTRAEQTEVEHAQQVAQAEIALRVARWQLEEARTQEQAEYRAHASAVALAQSQSEQIDWQLAQARTHPPTAEVVAAQVGLTLAQDALEAARAEYQKALDRPWEPQEVRDAYAKAVWRTEQEVKLAQAQLNSALDAQRAHEFGLEVLAAQRDAAAIQLTQTLDARVAYTVTFALLEAEVDLAQLQLDGLQAWKNPYLDPPPPDEIVQARALLRQAELTVEELEWRLQGAQLRAPFDGVISDVYLSPGEWGAAGAPVVELLDTTRWHIETRNVGELQIARVQVGQEVLVQVNAFRDETLHGRVATISPVAVVQQGDTTYTLMIELEPTDLNLRPGMTVQVEILVN